MWLGADGNKYRLSRHWAYMTFFSDAKNHKHQTFSRKVMGLCLLNVAMKERFKIYPQSHFYYASTRFKRAAAMLSL